MNGKIKKDIVKVTRHMYNTGLVNAYEGNVSVRCKDYVYITPAGIYKGIVKPNMLVKLDMAGNILSRNAYSPSSEYKLHMELYRLRADIGAVIHSHSTYSTAFAIARKPIETKAYPEMIVLFDKIPLVEYGTPGSEKVYEGIKKYVGYTDVFLLANHGIVSAGADIWDALRKIEAVEKTAKTLLMAGLLGGECPIEDDGLEELYVMRMKLFGKGKESQMEVRPESKAAKGSEKV